MTPEKAPISFMLFMYIVMSACIAYVGMWFEKPNLVVFAVLGMLWYIGMMSFKAVRLLAEIRDQTKRTGQR